MPALPVLRSSDVVAAFEKLGWHIARQRGSHIIMVKDGSLATLAVPDHKEIAKGAGRVVEVPPQKIPDLDEENTPPPVS